MQETMSNVELAHRIHEHGHAGQGGNGGRDYRLEIAEAIALALVAVLTAWSS